MSIFDPHALYYHPEKKTHKGQIIQKKPTNLQHAISKSEIPRSISVLKSYGYEVYPPGEGKKSTIYSDTICKTYVFNVDVNSQQYERTVNTLWTDISLDFANILDEKNIVSFELGINIPSLLISTNGGSGQTLSVDTEKISSTVQITQQPAYRILYNSLGLNSYRFLSANSTAGVTYSQGNYVNPDDSALLIDVHTDDVEVYQQLSTQGYLTDDVVLFLIQQSGSNIGICNYTVNVQFTISYISEVIPVN